MEMPEFNCCGFPIDPINHDMAIALATRNLCLAEQLELDIMTLCNGCFSTLNNVNRTLKENKKVKQKVNEYLKEINMEFRGLINVKHLIHVLAEDLGFEKIKKKVKKKLSWLRVAEYSGCHLSRPAKHSEEDPENPTTLKKLVELTGVECLDYIGRTECCGGPILGVNEEIPLHLVFNKLRRIKEAGAQALITICPFCHLNFDLNQRRVEKVFNENFRIPVIHYTQLLGLALGIEPEELALKDLRVDASKIINSL